MNEQTQQQTKDFFSRYPERTYKKGEIIMRPGDASHVYFVESGTIMQYDIAENGEKLVVNTYGAGAFILLATILNDIAIDFFFEAQTTVTVRVAPRHDVAEFLKGNPPLVLATLARLSRGTNGLLHRVAQIMQGGAEAQILQTLTTIQARFPSDDGSIAITAAQVAEQTGLARETVSRAIKRLRVAGKITTTRGKITLL
ncbi:MAG: Crp/Fnr family transcriptional regulator [Candidatus Saccharimonas sp.]